MILLARNIFVNVYTVLCRYLMGLLLCLGFCSAMELAPNDPNHRVIFNQTVHFETVYVFAANVINTYEWQRVVAWDNAGEEVNKEAVGDWGYAVGVIYRGSIRPQGSILRRLENPSMAVPPQWILQDTGRVLHDDFRQQFLCRYYKPTALKIVESMGGIQLSGDLPPAAKRNDRSLLPGGLVKIAIGQANSRASMMDEILSAEIAIDLPGGSVMEGDWDAAYGIVRPGDRISRLDLDMPHSERIRFMSGDPIIVSGTAIEELNALYDFAWPDSGATTFVENGIRTRRNEWSYDEVEYFLDFGVTDEWFAHMESGQSLSYFTNGTSLEEFTGLQAFVWVG